jgi:hypothetical protein
LIATGTSPSGLGVRVIPNGGSSHSWTSIANGTWYTAVQDSNGTNSVQNSGVVVNCNTTSTTTTTTTAAITCNNYQIEGAPSIDVEWLECDGTPNSDTVTTATLICAQTGSVSQTGGAGTIVQLGPCSGPPTTTTTTSTTTSTTTATPVGLWKIANTSDDLDISGIDIGGSPGVVTVGAFPSTSSTDIEGTTQLISIPGTYTVELVSVTSGITSQTIRVTDSNGNVQTQTIPNPNSGNITFTGVYFNDSVQVLIECLPAPVPTTTTTTQSFVNIDLYANQEGLPTDLDFHISTDGGSTWNFSGGAPFSNTLCPGSATLSFSVVMNSSLSVRLGSDISINTYYRSNRNAVTCPNFDDGTAQCEWPILTNTNRTFYFTTDYQNSSACLPSTTTTTTTETPPSEP